MCRRLFLGAAVVLGGLLAAAAARAETSREPVNDVPSAATPADGAAAGEPAGAPDSGEAAEGLSGGDEREDDAAGETADGSEDEGRDVAELCRLMTTAADRHGVPPDFFIRLIWKESRFDPNAVSPVGALGIAQFMPGTARIRGLKDPFDREEALFASASFLADLEARFGSWGLAAAGYNGGPNRVPPFVAGEGWLPSETLDYVYSITGRTAHYWARRAREAAEAAGAAEGAADPDAAGREAPRLALDALVARVAADGIPGIAWRDEAVTGDPSAQGGAEPRAGDDALAGAPGGPWHAPLAGGGAGVVLAAHPDPRGVTGDALIAAAASVAIPVPRPDYEPATVDCPDLVARLGRSRAVAMPASGGEGGWTPWGAQVAGHPKRAIALGQYDRLRARLPADLVARGPTIVVRRFAARGRLPIHAVMFAASGRAEASELCRRIAAARAPCVVVRNR